MAARGSYLTLGSVMGWLASLAAAAAAAILVASGGGTRGWEGLAAIGVASVVLWMFTRQQVERPLVVVLLYLGLLDGYVKLRTDSSGVTLIRDALIYAVMLGYLARALLRRQTLRLPPLSGWVLAFAVVVVVQLANPADIGIRHTLGALRPHLEFLPLFFVGYALLQTRSRLRTFFAIMLVIAMANGIVGAIQLNLTPAQLSSWGPGYAYRINGNGRGLNDVSGRVFTTVNGKVRVRPLGLGDDMGIGAAWGMLALGGALALVSLRMRRPWMRAALILLCLGPPLAIITGEGRAYVLASLVALFAYVAFATTARRLIPTLAAVLVGLAAAVGVTAFISSVSGSGVFERYLTVTPSHLTSQASQSRGSSFAAIPTLFTSRPLGNGLGSAGPAEFFAGGGNSGSNGETEPGFLLSELGIPGLIVVYGFNLALLVLAITRIRRLDPETRSLVAALLAGIVALLILGISQATTSIAPMSPYLWFAGGALSYWLTAGVRKSQEPPRAHQARTSPGVAVLPDAANLSPVG